MKHVGSKDTGSPPSRPRQVPGLDGRRDLGQQPVGLLARGVEGVSARHGAIVSMADALHPQP